MDNTIVVDRPTFKESCEVLSGDYRNEEGIEICTIRRGVASYTYIRKSDNKVEVIAKGGNRLQYVGHISNHKGTTCYIYTSDGEPSESECVYYNDEDALVVDVSPLGHSITVSKYGFGGKTNGYVILSTTDEKLRETMQIAEDYADLFLERFLTKTSKFNR